MRGGIAQRGFRLCGFILFVSLRCTTSLRCSSVERLARERLWWVPSFFRENSEKRGARLRFKAFEILELIPESRKKRGRPIVDTGQCQQIDLLTHPGVSTYNGAMAIRSYNVVHSDEKRHKCHKCGSVRYESYMRPLKHTETRAASQFGNDKKCWGCKKHDIK